jgi:hypothetical protein
MAAAAATRAHHHDLSFFNEVLSELLRFDRTNLFVR